MCTGVHRITFLRRKKIVILPSPIYGGVLPTAAVTSLHLSLLSDSVTAKKCDCTFSVKIKVVNFKTKIQWAILEFSEIR